MNTFVEWIRDDLDLVSVVIQMSVTEMNALLASFDANSATSPSAADSREVARPVCEALVAKLAEE